MILLLLPYAIQILLIIHAIRNGKNTTWIWLLIMLPYVGGLIYFVMEVWPDLRRGRLIDTEALVGLVDKNVAIRRLKENLLVSDTPANKRALADEYFRLGAFVEAENHYEALLVGHYKDDRGLLLNVADTAFRRGAFDKAQEFYVRAERQGVFTATDAKARVAYSRFRAAPTTDNLRELEQLFELTKNSEVAALLAQGYVLLGEPAKIDRLVAIVAVQHKNARGVHRSNMGRYLAQLRRLRGTN